MKKWYSLYLDDEYKIFKLKQYLKLTRITFEPSSSGIGVVFMVYAEQSTVNVINEYLDTIA